MTRSPVAMRLGAAALLAAALLSGTAHPATAAEQSYEDQLLRLSEILGAVHHLRDICGANEGTLWREQMLALLEAEEPPGPFRARLIAAFNNGYRGFQRTYSACTTSAKRAADRFFTEGSQIAASLAIALEAAAPEPTGDTDGTDEVASDPAAGEEEPGTDEAGAEEPAAAQ